MVYPPPGSYSTPLFLDGAQLLSFGDGLQVGVRGATHFLAVGHPPSPYILQTVLDGTQKLFFSNEFAQSVACEITQNLQFLALILVSVRPQPAPGSAIGNAFAINCATCRLRLPP